MPATYRIDSDRGVVITTLQGRVTDRDLADHQRQVRADPAFHPGLDQLVDGRAITEVRVTSGGVRAVAVSDYFAEGTRRALVMDSDVAYGMARMFEMLRASGPEEVRVFRTIGEAQVWLALTR